MKLQFSDIRLAFQWVEDLSKDEGEFITTPTYTKDALSLDNDYDNDEMDILVTIVNSALDLMGNSNVRVAHDRGSYLVSILR